MIDLIKHAEGIRQKLAGIYGAVTPTVSPVVQPNALASRYQITPPVATPQPFSLMQDAKTKGDIEFQAFNDRTTRLAGDTRPLRGDAALAAQKKADELKMMSVRQKSDAAYAAMNARTTTLTPNVLAARVTAPSLTGNQYGIQPGQMPSVADVPSLNVLERKQHLAQIGARR